MRVAGLFLLTMMFFFPLRMVQAAIPPSELYVAAGLVSMASYSEELNLLTRQWLIKSGWHFDSNETINRAADGRFHLVSRRLADGNGFYLLAFPGTERLKDAEIDLRVGRVPFGGKTPEEFRALASSGVRDASRPLVHQGFNDYTQTALFHQALPAFGGRTAGEVMAEELRAHPAEVLYLTGHSLGGAAATLAAARLADMGVRPEQLQVITFGAPAVGNEAFARAYEKRMQLTRITMEGDPVQGVLQTLSGGAFVQYGNRVSWKQNRNTERFAHEMVVYLDQAIRSDQEARPESGAKPLLFGSRPAELDGGILAAPARFDLDAHIREDRPYMERAVRDMLKNSYQPIVFAAADAGNMRELRRQAADSGCAYILMQRYQAVRIRQEKYNFRLSLEESLYDARGNLLTMQVLSTTARNLTPLEGTAYLQMKAAEQRDAHLKQAAAGAEEQAQR